MMRPVSMTAAAPFLALGAAGSVVRGWYQHDWQWFAVAFACAIAAVVNVDWSKA